MKNNRRKRKWGEKGGVRSKGGGVKAMTRKEHPNLGRWVLDGDRNARKKNQKSAKENTIAIAETITWGGDNNSICCFKKRGAARAWGFGSVICAGPRTKKGKHARGAWSRNPGGKAPRGRKT